MPAKKNYYEPDPLAAAWLMSRKCMNKKPKLSRHLDASTMVFLGLLKEAAKAKQCPQGSYNQVANMLSMMADIEAERRADLIRRVEKLELQFGIKRKKK